MSVIKPNDLRYIKRAQLAEEQRLMANYYQDIIRSYGIDVLYIKRDTKFETSGVNSDTVYGHQANGTFSLSSNMVTYMEVDNSVLALNGLGLVPQDESTFYFSINDFGVCFANSTAQYAMHPIYPTSGYLDYNTEVITKCFKSDANSGIFTFDIGMNMSGTNIYVPLSAEPVPKYAIAINQYLHTTFTSDITGGYSTTFLYLTYQRGKFSNYNRLFYSVSGYVLYTDLQLALKHSTVVRPAVGDIIRIDFPENEQLEEYEINEVLSRRPTSHDGVNPLLGKYIWKCKATRRIPSHETIQNTEVQVENATEDLMDIIKKTQHTNIDVYKQINDYSVEQNDSVYGGYSAADDLVLDPDRYTLSGNP